MRFSEFKIIKEASEQKQFCTVGDSHAHAVGQMGGKDWLNLAVGGASSKGTHPKIQQMLSNISQVPKGSVVLISLGANDTANAMTAGKPSRSPASIAADVAGVVDRVRAQGPSKIVFLLFPNGPGRGSKDAKFYGGEFQDEVRAAIKSAIGNVEIIDINGKPLTDGVHAGMSTYKEVANQVRAKGGAGVTLGPSSAAPGAPATKDKEGAGTKPSTGVLDVPSGRQGPAVRDVQQALIALGYKLPQHGADGIRGPETVSAVEKFQQDNSLAVDGDPGPETVAALNKQIASKGIKITKSTSADVKSASSAGDIDTSAIQDPDFNKKLDKIANALGVSSKDLIAIMKMESRVDPAAVNKLSGATGLIQFMPDTARSLGTSVEELRKMSAVDQLDYVYKYFKMVGVKPGMELGDLYMAVFMPKYVGADNSTVLGQDGASGFSGKVYAQNKGLDRNKDGSITVADVKSSVQRFA